LKFYDQQFYNLEILYLLTKTSTNTVFLHLTMARSNKKSSGIIYEITRIYIKVMHFFYFKKSEFYGVENVKKNTPIIFAANHQGTFIDGAIIALGSNTQASFLARADIFKNKFLLPILNAYKLVPIYRKRDGVNTIEANKNVFSGCYEMLEQGGAPTIFPEGSHNNKFHLRSFKKGAARIAFGSEVKNNWQLGTYVIPAGIHYEKNRSVRRSYYIEYAQPFFIRDYKAAYEANPEKTINEFTKELYATIKSKTLHIYDFENAYLINDYFKMHENNDTIKPSNQIKTLRDRVMFNQIIADDLNIFENENKAKYEQFIDLLKIYFQALKEQRHRDWQFVNKNPNPINVIMQSVVLTLLFPLWLVSFLNNLATYCFTKFTIKKQFKSPDWMGTAKYITALLSGPVIFLIQSVFIFILFKSWIVWLCYLIACPFLILFWHQYNKKNVQFFSQMRLLKNSNSSKIKAIHQLRKEILSFEFD